MFHPIRLIKKLIFGIIIILLVIFFYPYFKANVLPSITIPKGLSQYIPSEIIPTEYPTDFDVSTDIKSLADEAKMTNKAKNIFYSANPVIDTDRSTFDKHCKAPVSSRFVELGCYTSDNHIYLLNIPDSKLNNQMIVTAAHEMLHAAYAKLSDEDKITVDKEIESNLPSIRNKELNQEIANYRLTEPGERDNELHSIMGTEYFAISNELETYYKDYFEDRAVVVNYSEEFKKVFSNLEDTLTSIKSQIETTRDQMSRYLAEDDTSDYNYLVPKFNSLVKQYNLTVKEYNRLSRSLKGEESSQK